ncbi:MAG TPA: hypothetical protein VJT81_01735 [Burkholderiales bacterium]|nr:hypothetical protein [Burkholderiales bacterium]
MGLHAKVRHVVMLAALCLMAAWNLPNYAERTDPLKFTAKVRLHVSADTSIKSSIVSYLSRELRSLGDVEIVDENPGWELYVVAMEVTTVSGIKTGFALTSVVINPFDNQKLSPLLQPVSRDLGLTITQGLVNTNGHWLYVGGELQNLCKQAVTDFDVTLEESRKINRILKSFIEKKQ